MGKTPVICLLALASCLGAFAQTVAGFGSVTGLVHDPYGDGLPDTTVLIYNDHTGLRRIMATTDDGFFSATEITPGTGYNIKVSRTGYLTWEYKDFDVSVGNAVDFAIVLNLESASPKDENFSGFASAVDEMKNNVSTVISHRQLENLPDGDRALEPFAALAPLVTQDRNSGALIFRGEADTNAFYTDGSDTTTTYFHQTPAMAPQMNPDSVLEMEVLSTGAPADFGWAKGGTVNAATPSGGNAYHGAAYGYLGNPAWQSVPRFDPAFHPDDRQRHYGASVGGPVRTHNLFFFVNAERETIDSQGITQLANPLLAGPSGASLASNCKASALQCTNAINLLTPEIGKIVSRSTSAINGLARIDYRRSDHNAFSVEGSALHNNSPNGLDNEAVSPNGGLLAGNGNYIDETRFAKGDWNTAIGSLITNDLHGGVYIDRFSDTLDRALLPSTGALAINIAGTPVGGNPAAPSTLTETRYDLNDSFSFVAGPHALKLGAEMARNRDGMTQLYNGAGSYTYPSLTAFAEDFTPVGQPRNYTEFNQTVGEPVTDIRSTEIAAYAQDEWKAGRRLRFTLGARWEKVKFPKPPSTSTAYYQVDTIASPSTDFAPRAGGTYLLDDRTVIRGGLGFYYEPFTGQLMREMYAETDFNQNTLTGTPGQSGSLVFPKVVAGFTSVPGGLQDIIYGTNKFRNPYEEVGTLSIERRLNARTSIALSYVDDRGQRLWTAVDQNLSTPNVIAPNYGYETYTIDNAAGTATGTYTTVVYTLQTIATNTTGKSDLNSAHVWEVWNSGGSKYHAVALQLREQMLYGLSLQGSYTWSHAIDDVNSAPVIGGVVPASYTPGDFRDDQGNSNFDQRNHAVINLTWQPPFLKSNSIPARFLINGWQISAVATLTSSLPETPVVLVNGQQFSGIDMLYVNSLNGSGGSNRVPFESVNSLAAGGETNVDARVTRMLPFTERIKGMLMVEAFNAFNHQYTTSVNNIAYTATSGVLKPVAGVGAPTAAYGAPFGTNARFCQVAFRITF